MCSSKVSSYETCKNKDEEKDGITHLNKDNEKQEIRNKIGTVKNRKKHSLMFYKYLHISVYIGPSQSYETKLKVLFHF